MKRLALAVLCTAAALALAACGERKEPAVAGTAPTKLNVVLDYVPNPDHAGLYAAIATGAFRKVKLDVRPQVPNDPAAPLRLLEAGRADLAISYEPEVLLARDKGAKVVAIGALVQTPLTSVMSLGKKPVGSPGDLKGKTVGTAGIPYQDAYLTAIERKGGVQPADVKKVDVGFNLVPAMISHRVDATLGAFWNVEGVQLQRRHEHPTILRVDRLGVPTYNELVIVAREDEARSRGAVLRRFMQGLAGGHAALKQNPETGIAPLLKANKDLDRGFAEASVKATMDAFFPKDTTKPFGWMEENQWLAYGRWMFDNGLLKRQEDPRRALTTEFLPGEGPRQDGS